MEEKERLEAIRQEVIEGLKAGKPMFGKDGAFAPLIEDILNAVLEGEMDAHLTEEERENGNRRNGKMQTQVRTSVGEITVSTPRDRDGSFDPQMIRKRETVLAESMSDQIIGMYALGAGTREISAWMEDTVGSKVSAETISAVTDRVLPELKAWICRLQASERVHERPQDRLSSGKQGICGGCLGEAQREVGRVLSDRDKVMEGQTGRIYPSTSNTRRRSASSSTPPTRWRATTDRYVKSLKTRVSLQATWLSRSWPIVTSGRNGPCQSQTGGKSRNN